MFGFLERLTAKKARVVVRILGVRRENSHYISNTVQMWNIPGRMQTLPGSRITIEMEGSEELLQRRVKELALNPFIKQCGHPLDVRWLPFAGMHKSFTASF